MLELLYYSGMSDAEESRKKLRFAFSPGQRPLVQYKVLSPNAPNQIFKAALLDLSESGARLLGDLPYVQIYDLGIGFAKLGCNFYLNDNLVKVPGLVRWFKPTASGDYEFGLMLEADKKTSLELQKFLIRHQIDTRRFSRRKAAHEEKINSNIRG